ncbi:MAG: hypothetical protein HQK68_00200 [Desulfamplus sp.]|nr:hypothetical protein [Desulfamplus sp.]
MLNEDDFKHEQQEEKQQQRRYRSASSSSSSPASDELSSELENKKSALISNLSDDNRNLLKLSRDEMLKERDKLQSEIEALENKNHLSSRQLHDIKFAIKEKLREKVKAEQRADGQNRELLKLLTEESSLTNEIEFYNSEKADIADVLDKLTLKMESSIRAVEKSVKDIGFIKGETGALIDRIGRLETDIPEKSSHVEGLDDSIFGAVKALESLYGRMHSIEKSAKAHYYNIKGESRGRHDNS